MPPSAVRTVRDLLFWQYAKIIAQSAGMGKEGYPFIMDRFKKLQGGQINWSGSIHEYIREREQPDICLFCGADRDLSYDHLVPRSRGGPDSADNVVMACRSCNSSKGARGLFEWVQLEGKDGLPPIAEGKYLKLLYTLHEGRGTLDAGRDDLVRLCDGCEVGHLCKQRTLTVYCLESILGRPP